MTSPTPDAPYRRKVGSARPNSLLYAGGVGAVTDLPHLSVVVKGLDDWDYREATETELTEPRLLARVRQILGPSVKHLRPAPRRVATSKSEEELADRVGVPVAPFPRWLRCPACYELGALNSDGRGAFEFRNENKYRPDEARFVHATCPKKTQNGSAPTAVPARFVTVCRNGHLDEFPWVEYVHRGGPCAKGREGRIKMMDPGGQSGAVIQLRCSCGQSRTMRDALSHHRRPDSVALPACRGRHPHLGVFEAGCDQTLRAMVLGASNSWFPLLASALYVPELASEVGLLVEKQWPILQEVTTKDQLAPMLKFVPQLVDLRAYDLDLVWGEVEARHNVAADDDGEAIDLSAREYEALADPSKAARNTDFTADVVAAPAGWEPLVDRVVRVSRLRETKALVGFTRVDAPDWGEPDAASRAPISRRKDTDWVPAATTHGEGIFLVLNGDLVHKWEETVEGSTHLLRLRSAHNRWRHNRELPGTPADFWPGDRYLLLHTLSHLLVREIALECGYSSASITERVYANRDRDEAGVLLYTAASDSEGTLGGLVRLSDPVELDRVLRAVFANANRCSSDPICADHLPLDTEDTLHGAACHACLFASETTCQRGNRFLDRALIVPVADTEEHLALADLFDVPGR